MLNNDNEFSMDSSFLIEKLENLNHRKINKKTLQNRLNGLSESEKFEAISALFEEEFSKVQEWLEKASPDWSRKKLDDLKELFSKELPVAFIEKLDNRK